MSPGRRQRRPRRGQSRPKNRSERPQGAPRAPQGDFPAIQPPSGHHFEAQNQFFLVEKMFFYIVFAGRFFYRFLAAPGHPQTLKIKPNPCRGAQNQGDAKIEKESPGDTFWLNLETFWSSLDDFSQPKHEPKQKGKK